MEMSDLGFDGWFAQRSASLLQPGLGVARVTAVDRGAFLVRNRDAERYAELAGKFRFAVQSATDLPCVGDWVCVQGHASGGPALIHGVVPRRTFLRRKCPGKTYGLLGSSGVGKTTLINRLIGRDAFDTRAVSGTGEGVHTTARRQLHLLAGGALLIDTPGMRELGLLGARDGMNQAFAQIRELALNCRFPNCTHTEEPDCAVRMAVEKGAVSEARYRNYLKLRKETEYHDLSYVEKRKKDRAFGRFIKSAKKSMKE